MSRANELARLPSGAQPRFDVSLHRAAAGGPAMLRSISRNPLRDGFWILRQDYSETHDCASNTQQETQQGTKQNKLYNVAGAPVRNREAPQGPTRCARLGSAGPALCFFIARTLVVNIIERKGDD